MTFVPVSQVNARVQVDDVVAALRPDTCLVSIMLANNETGVVMVRMKLLNPLTFIADPSSSVSRSRRSARELSP